METSERIMRELNAFMDEHQEDLDNGMDLDELLRMFNETGRNKPMDESNAATAEDFAELAMNERQSKKREEYARKALELDPHNIDAGLMLAVTKDEEETYQNLQKLKEDAWIQLEKGGFTGEDSIGHFYQIVETRPYLRVLEMIAEFQFHAGRHQDAMEIYEEMIRLNEDDNRGARANLMVIYAIHEMEDKALALQEKYGEYDETMTMLALSILYYRKMDYRMAKKYLRRLLRINRETDKFLKCYYQGDLPSIREEISEYGYHPFTAEELLVLYEEGMSQLLDSVRNSYPEWVFYVTR